MQEHSLQVAVAAHALAIIGNKYFGASWSPERLALLGIFHDASEVFTGDMPTPAKYFSPEIRDAYRAMEREAGHRLLNFLPHDLREDYAPLITPGEAADTADLRMIKAADSICAYLKCLEEIATGNREFSRAKISLEEKIRSMGVPEADWFMRHFAPSFSLSLDELGV